MSSAGQVVGGVVGAIVGFFTPIGPMYGAQIGMMVGGAIDPPKGPKIQGPRLSDLTVQTATYGAPIPRCYGTVAMTGNILWLEGNRIKEVSKKTKQGGKGSGSQSTVENFTYFATFAVGLCEGPIEGIRRIWVGSKLVYDAGSDDPATVYASNQLLPGVAIYLGTDTQQPDPRLQADVGIANAPAYRGLAYLVFYDLPLADYGNSLLGAQVKAEVITTGGVTQYHRKYFRTGVFPTISVLYGRGPFNPRLNSGVMEVSGGPWQYKIGLDGTLLSQEAGVPGEGEYGFIGYLEAKIPVPVQYEGTGGTSGIGLGDLLVDGAKLISRTGGASQDFAGACIGADRQTLYVIQKTDGAYYLDLYEFGGDGPGGCELIASIPQSLITPSAGSSYAPWIPGDMQCFAVESDGVHLWRVSPVDLQIDLFKIDVSARTLTLEHAFPLYGDDSLPAGDFSAVAADHGVCVVVGKQGWTCVFTRTASNVSVYPHLSDVVSAEFLRSGLLDNADIDTSGLTDVVRGYRVSEVAAIRSAVEPLRGAWPFDVIQSGYQIKAKRRGASSVVTIPASMLDARGDGEAPGVQITSSREMDAQLPRRVVLKHIDADREYDVGEQYAERLNTDAINVQDQELPIVLTGSECAGMAEVLLYLYWIERYDVSFRLPPSYRGLEPADVVTITGEWGEYELRLTQVHYLSDGRLECQAKFNSAAIYTPKAPGETGLRSGVTIAPRGPSLCVLLDIPTLRDIYSGPGFPAAVAGYYSGWPGGVLYRSTDLGLTWTDIQSYAGPVTMGTALNAIGAGRLDVIDAANILNARIVAGTLESVSELAMLNGANHFAYGDTGRWEIIAAKNCVLQSDGTYLLSNLLRGRYGSEWAMGTHQAGDWLVLLTDTDLAWVGMDTSSIGMSLPYRAVTIGESIDFPAPVTFTYTGVNLKPLAPVYLNGTRSTANDWSLSWTRRSRTGGEWLDAVDVPIGEASESYQVEIYSDADYTSIVRTITVSSPSLTYTSAQQVTDFGANQSILYVKVYQVSAIVGKGYPLTTSIYRVLAAVAAVAVLNTADCSADIVLSGASYQTATRASTNNSAWRTARGFVARTAGKRYFEITNDSDGAGNGYLIAGVTDSSLSLSAYVGSSANSFGLQANNTANLLSYSSSTGTVLVGDGSASLAPGQTMMVAVDFAAGKIWFGTKGTWRNGDPAAGTGQNYNFTPGTELFIGVSMYGTPEAVTVRAAAANLVYSLPSGFSAWND